MKSRRIKGLEAKVSTFISAKNPVTTSSFYCQTNNVDKTDDSELESESPRPPETRRFFIVSMNLEGRVRDAEQNRWNKSENGIKLRNQRWFRRPLEVIFTGE
ncbi:hypothetical protein L2E82_17161 [Cichorium intybus]|uniref:Uncharacterized protein n=1 Tax=Cichorium intybus TaxID=13427 RepID=A0ACB9F6V2_CICIN|nr:hypothetical protein L2E82_17161 [Cichorium intybus]